MQLKNQLNKFANVNALLFLAWLVPSQQYAFANETQKILLTTFADNPKSAGIFTVNSELMKKMKVPSKEKLIVKAKLKEKDSIKKLGKSETKTVLTGLIALKSIPQLQIKPIQEARPQLNKLVDRSIIPLKGEILSLKG